MVIISKLQGYRDGHLSRTTCLDCYLEERMSEVDAEELGEDER